MTINSITQHWKNVGKATIAIVALVVFTGCAHKDICKKSLNYRNDICLQDLKGNCHMLSEYRETEMILLYFWALYDGPGMELLKELNDISLRYNAKDVFFIAVLVVQEVYEEELNEFIINNDIKLTVMIDFVWQSIETTDIKDICFSNSSCGVLLDKKGNVIWSNTTAFPKEKEKYKKAIEQYILIK